MLKHLAIAAAMTCGSIAVYAQTGQTTAPPQAGATASAVGAADAGKLIGRNIQNAQNETIGEIKSVFIGPDGKVDSVMVGVGGFLGLGEREVRLAWNDLRIEDGGRKVSVDMSKDQLKGMPEYKYRDASMRGSVFTDKGPYRADATDRAKVSTGDFNAQGSVSAAALIGADVKNKAGDKVGDVEDVYLDKSGRIDTVVVSVGGFLGVGAKNVAVKWNEIQLGRDGNDVTLSTDWTKDSLKAMPDYKYERREQAQSR
ncbi:MAG: PRC-barrel domain-containing protein [Enhydrobacter sp.]|nr:MAG: PRC-barrel domain-containing protein [Enhydrobacter sp.]